MQILFWAQIVGTTPWMTPDSRVFHNKIRKGERWGDDGKSRHASGCLKGRNKGRKGPEIKLWKETTKGEEGRLGEDDTERAESSGCGPAQLGSTSLWSVFTGSASCEKSHSGPLRILRLRKRHWSIETLQSTQEWHTGSLMGPALS